MIVISGALVVVALVLLVIGVVQPSLGFVYGSIGVSLVSLAALVVGILQRRGETTPATEAAAEKTEAGSDDAVTAVVPTGRDREPVAASAADEPAGGGDVLVVEGRPRYHVEGCRYLTGKSAVEIDVLDAREEGFTPCGVCKPDDALTAAQGGSAAELADPDELEVVEAGEEPVVEEDVPGVEVPAARSGRTRKVTSATAKSPGKAPATAPSKAPSKAPTKAPTRAATKAAASAPAKAPATATAAPAGVARKGPTRAAAPAVAPSAAARAATGSARPGSVVVIPDRGKFHKPECRFVRGVSGTETMTRSQADRAGYASCGVCKA